ncbi:MAG: hypothetical protein ACJ75S_06760 [Solirubrobacterales bacterium]
MAIEQGVRVRQKVPVIEGEVIDVEYDKSAKQLRYLVEYESAPDEDGDTKTRWFTESEIEEVE